MVILPEDGSSKDGTWLAACDEGTRAFSPLYRWLLAQVACRTGTSTNAEEPTIGSVIGRVPRLLRQSRLMAAMVVASLTTAAGCIVELSRTNGRSIPAWWILFTCLLSVVFPAVLDVELDLVYASNGALQLCSAKKAGRTHPEHGALLVPTASEAVQERAAQLEDIVANSTTRMYSTTTTVAVAAVCLPIAFAATAYTRSDAFLIRATSAFFAATWPILPFVLLLNIVIMWAAFPVIVSLRASAGIFQLFHGLLFTLCVLLGLLATLRMGYQGCAFPSNGTWFVLVALPLIILLLYPVVRLNSRVSSLFLRNQFRWGQHLTLPSRTYIISYERQFPLCYPFLGLNMTYTKLVALGVANVGVAIAVLKGPIVNFLVQITGGDDLCPASS